ncbi:MAG: hypothetical protein JNL33_04890 [Betaproteobacteria bacterium]|nr:hypothetical protein [Betaproteobacteria bacterium]
MSRALLLVDFENVQQVDLSRLAEGTDAVIFVGASQKAVPIELVTSAQKLGARVEWQRVEGNGGNALDFHIACHLGRVLERAPHLHCTVLSKDKGFDPLLRQLNKSGLKCRRIDSMLELDPKAAPVEDPNYRRVVEILGKSEKRTRPRKRKTLSQHISAMFQKKLAQTDIDRIIDMLFAKKLISEANDSISYAF